MTIWILAVALFLIGAGLGFLLGFWRTLVMLIGTWVGALAAQPLGEMLMPLLPKIGLKSLFWNEIIAPWFGFFIVQLVFLILAFVVHWKIAQVIRYRADEVTFLKWQRLVRRSGFALGLVVAIGYLIMVGGMVYPIGYATVQVTSSSNPPKGFQMLNNARRDLRSTGFDKFLEWRDQTPEKFYKAADVVGMIYHTPLLLSRLGGYPAMLGLDQRSEIQAIRNDSSFNEVLQRQGDFTKIYNDDKIQKVIENNSLKTEFAKIDLDDLKNYLKTGETDKFEENIVGRWKLDNYLAAREVRDQLSGLPVSVSKLVRRALLMVDVTMINTLDGDSFIKVKIPTEEIQKLTQEAAERSAAADQRRAATAAARAQALAQQQQQQSQQQQRREEISRQMQNTYGTSNTQANQTAQQQGTAMLQRRPAQAEEEIDPTEKVTDILGTLSQTTKGQWTRVGHRYDVTITQGGQTGTMEARIVKGDLELKDENGVRLVFYKN